MRDPKAYYFRQWRIRPQMVRALESYRDVHLPTGDFLRAIITNDFMRAAQHADDDNLANLPAYAAYVYNELPYNIHGSQEAYDAHIAAKA